MFNQQIIEAFKDKLGISDLTTQELYLAIRHILFYHAGIEAFKTKDKKKIFTKKQIELAWNKLQEGYYIVSDTVDYIKELRFKEMVKRQMEMRDRYDESKKSKKIFITEEQEKYIRENKDVLKEEELSKEEKHQNKPFFINPDKVNIVKKYLDKGFKRNSLQTIDDNGYPKTIKIVTMMGSDGNPLRNMSDKHLFYLLQDRFQKIVSDTKQRDNFLIQIIKDWYNDKITNGLLTVNMINENQCYFDDIENE